MRCSEHLKIEYVAIYHRMGDSRLFQYAVRNFLLRYYSEASLVGSRHVCEGFLLIRSTQGCFLTYNIFYSLCDTRKKKIIYSCLILSLFLSKGNPILQNFLLLDKSRIIRNNTLNFHLRNK